MKVTVKQLDINRGIQGDPWSCPIARAVNRALGLPRTEGVETDGTYVRVPFSDVRASLPKKVEWFVRDFDSYGPEAVAPFSFVMRRPA